MKFESNIRTITPTEKDESINVFTDETKLCTINLPEDDSKLKAIYQPSKFWMYYIDQTTYSSIYNPINIKFLNEPDSDANSTLKRSYTAKMQEIVDRKGDLDEINYDRNGKLINWDPLEYEFYRDFPNLKTAIIQIVMQRYQPLIDIPIIFVDDTFPNENTQIRISFNKNKGCNSFIGMDNISQPTDLPTMNFAWFDVGTVLHEFGHVLGLEHEHQSPFGKEIKWRRSLLDDYFLLTNGWDSAKVTEQITKRYTETEVKGTPYDPESIMLYFFPSYLTTDGIGTTQNQRLSPLDVITINRLYCEKILDIDTGEIKDIVDLTELDDYYFRIYGVRFLI